MLNSPVVGLIEAVDEREISVITNYLVTLPLCGIEAENVVERVVVYELSIIDRAADDSAELAAVDAKLNQPLIADLELRLEGARLAVAERHDVSLSQLRRQRETHRRGDESGRDHLSGIAVPEQ